MAPRSLFKDYGGGTRQRPRLDDANLMEQTTLEYLASMEGGSVFFRENHPRAMASLEPSELELNKIIGMGEFGIVIEVTAVNLRTCTSSRSTVINSTCCPSLVHCPLEISITTIPRDSLAFLKESQSCSALHSMWTTTTSDTTTKSTISLRATSDSSASTSTLEQQQTLRAYVSTHTKRRNAFSRYAVKQLRKDLYPKKKTEAAKDLGREAKFLSCLQHPNIVKLRGTVSNPGQADFMILLDYLQTTLSEQMVEWKQQEEPSVNFLIPWQSQQRIQQQQTLVSDRLLALYDVASAMRYLHQKLILFRDLKPENVARNHHHAMQLFDFGLAKELKAGDLVIARNGHEHGHNQYRLTGLTGTLRIMAPEVIQCQPYGLPADVYSFGILLWEVFEGTKNQLTAMEISQQNQRPELPANNGMRMPLDALIQQCWAANITDRPTFDTICQELQSQLLAMDKETMDRLPTSVIHRSEYLQQLSLESSESDMEQ